MYIVVGLGNPEKKYEHTRHNVGFDVLNVLSQQENIPINKSRCKGREYRRAEDSARRAADLYEFIRRSGCAADELV